MSDSMSDDARDLRLEGDTEWESMLLDRMDEWWVTGSGDWLDIGEVWMAGVRIERRDRDWETLISLSYSLPNQSLSMRVWASHKITLQEFPAITATLPAIFHNLNALFYPTWGISLGSLHEFSIAPFSKLLNPLSLHDQLAFHTLDQSSQLSVDPILEL